MDYQTGMVLWEHNADTRLPIASTTKIMTAMVILDYGGKRLDEQVVISDNAFNTGWSSTFAAGEVVRLGDVLKAVLIASSNSGAVAAAEHLAGSETAFVERMNAKAKSLGLHNTHFVNTHGLNVQGHYSSAHDLAIMARYALGHYPLMREIVRSGHPQPVGIPVTPRGRVMLWNKNRLLGAPVPGIPGSVFCGMKTGFVNASGSCLVSTATLGGQRLIGVLLNSPRLFPETQDLMHYGFSRFQWVTYATDERGINVPVRRGAARMLQVGAKDGLVVPVLKSASGAAPEDRVVFQGTCRAPVERGQRVGTLEVWRGGERIASVPAFALQAVPVAWWVRLYEFLEYSVFTLVALTVLGKVYGKIAKNSRRRRRRALASAGGGTDYRRPGDR